MAIDLYRLEPYGYSANSTLGNVNKLMYQPRSLILQEIAILKLDELMENLWIEVLRATP